MNTGEADNCPHEEEGPATQLVYSDEWGYVEVTKKGVIGIGTGKWPGSEGQTQPSE